MTGSRIVKVGFSDSHLLAFLQDGRIVSTPLVWYSSLQQLHISELHAYTLIGRRRGVEWESIDFQLSLEGMIEGVPERGSAASLAGIAE